MREYFVYILAHKPHGAIYIGVTNDLIRRVYEHKEGFIRGHAEKYHIRMLVYYEIASDVTSAIAREKLLKRWKRSWKEDLINAFNPTWRDLYPEICGCHPVQVRESNAIRDQDSFSMPAFIDPASSLRSVRDDKVECL